MKRAFLPVLALVLTLPSSGHGDDIVLGMSAAFSGPARSLGIELYRGSQAVFDEINRRGGVHGRRIVLRAYDDGYDPNRAIENTLRLIEEDRVFALFDYVGTPTVTRVLPLLKHYSDDHLLLFFPFTGAEPQRRPPYAEFVFNLRASYQEETSALVTHFLQSGHERIGVFYQADAYGRGGWEGVRRALRSSGRDVYAEATYSRGAEFHEDMYAQVELLRNADVQAVIAVCASAACAAFIRDARAGGWDIPIANLSFSGSEAIAELLQQTPGAPGTVLNSDVIITQVVPSYEDCSLPAVRAYRVLMEQVSPDLPPAVEDSNYVPQRLSFASFEGYLNARLLIRLLENLGPELQKENLGAAVEQLQDVDLGIGVPVAFSPVDHQGSSAVFITRYRDGSFVPVDHSGVQEACSP